LIETFKLTAEDAHVALEACRRKALEIGVPMDIAVVDDGGSLLSFERMDGAPVGCIQIAIDKAYSAAVLGIATGDEAKVAQPGQLNTESIRSQEGESRSWRAGSR
jgi:uncharacterized protein GlcG (DUF336 family)